MPNVSTIPKLGEFTGSRGYISSAPKETGVTDYLAPGSENVILSGNGKTQNFNDNTPIPDSDGGQVMMNVIEDYASLGDFDDTSAYGSVFNVFSALFFIGAGLLRLAGESLLVTASSTLSLLIKRNGVYTDVLSGLFQAGLAQPSAPTIRAVNPPAGFTGKVNGVVSVVIWRIRRSTGAVSNRSESSNVVTAANQSIAVTLPLPDANGQDYWGIGVTLQGEGSVGSYFELIEVAETEVSQSTTYTGAGNGTNGDETLIVTGASLTSANIGWSVEIPSLSFTSYYVSITDADEGELADPLPADAINATTIISNAVDGQERTKVIEWRDGDLAGQPFAPSRDFPPPAALFGGTLEDRAFVDGAYADAVQSVGTGVKGSAFCPSEPGKPESYSPDTVIFTNDTPVNLLRADSIYYRLCHNSTYIVRYLGGENGFSIEPMWNIGISYQNNACLAEGNRLYIWAEGIGAVRMGADGSPDTIFANDVADDLMACTDASKRVVGQDGITGVCYCYEKTIWEFYPSLNAWSAPLKPTIEGNIKSCVTVRNQLLISDDLDNLYEYNTGTGSTAKIHSAWNISREFFDTIHSISGSVRTDNTNNPINIAVYCDGDETTEVDSIDIDPSRVGYQRLLPWRCNIQDAESHALRITITSEGGDSGLESVSSFGDSNSIMN